MLILGLKGLTIIPRAHVGYELAIIISYPISAKEIIMLLKTKTKKYRKILLFSFVKKQKDDVVQLTSG